MSEKECRKGDWYGLGIKDGSQGLTPVKYFDYEAACAEYNIKAKRDRYNEGHTIGLKTYCRYEMGKEVGESGEAVNQLCNGVAGYKKGFEDGKKLFVKAEQIKELKEEIIEKYKSKECSFDADCKQEGTCVGGNICLVKGDREALNYECTVGEACLVKKSCKTFTEFTSSGDKVSIDICEP